jgi:hypothetical protein
MSTDFEMTFKGQRDFEALYKAFDWCAGNGYSYGRLERGAPIGLLRGDFIFRSGAAWMLRSVRLCMERSRLRGLPIARVR